RDSRNGAQGDRDGHPHRHDPDRRQPILPRVFGAHPARPRVRRRTLPRGCRKRSAERVSRQSDPELHDGRPLLQHPADAAAEAALAVGVIVGVDFDNTIASYDALMRRLATEWGMVEHGMRGNKKLIRDRLRQLPDGESKWRRLQTHCYGPGIIDAPAMDGVQRFFASCKARRIPLWI